MQRYTDPFEVKDILNQTAIEQRQIEKVIYPNPCSDFFKLNISQKGFLRIYSENGKCIRTIHDYEGQSVSAASLKEGTYIIKYYSLEATEVGVLLKE